MRVSYMSPLNTKSRWMKPSFWAASRVISIATPPQTVVIHHPGLVFCVSRVHCQQPTTSYQPQPPTQTTTGNPTRKMIERSLNNGAAALTVLFTDDGSDGWYGKWEPFLKKKNNLGKVIGQKNNLFRPEEKIGIPSPLCRKNPWESYYYDENDRWEWWEWCMKLQLFLPTCGLPWVNVMRIKIKVDATIKKMMNIAPDRAMLKCEKSTHLGTQKANPVPVRPWK